MPAVWQVRELRPIHHRIIWWLVDTGAIGKTLARGWQKECSNDLGIHRITLNRAISKMTAWGILSAGEKRGEAIMNPVLFERRVDRSKVKIKEQ